MKAKDAILKFCSPNDKLGSVIDVLNIFVDVIEMRNNPNSRESIDQIISKEVPKLELIPFYNFHKSALTAFYLQATNQKEVDPSQFFVTEAIPSALLSAMPSKTLDYGLVREKVMEFFKE